MYASVCDFLCIALLLPFVLGFSLPVFLFVCFVFKYSFQHLLSLVDLFSGLVVLSFL